MPTPLAGLPLRWSRLLDRAAERSADRGPRTMRQPSAGAVLGAGMAVVWLLYLIPPIRQLWIHGHELRAGCASAVVIAYGLVIANALTSRREADWEDGRQPPARAVAWVRLGALAVLFGIDLAVLGAPAASTALYIAVVAMFVLPPRQSGIVAFAVGVLFLAMALLPATRLGSRAVIMALIPSVIWFGREIGARSEQLRVLARRQQAELAISEERNRVARDVHDILGHSLTVITVKTELAQRLLDLDPDRARAELADVERLAREALAGVRDTVGGLREVGLAGELANARTALHAAGIVAELPDAEVPGARGIVFGWVLREAVTNVVRHSRARHCRVVVTPAAIEITDDGDGSAATVRFGSGLRGLRDRVRAAGGALALTTPPGGGLRLAATFDDESDAR
ncbi:sensor histidine kinase [Nocardia sp. alder85J]|uniref:sensor histidine kinase n=1 Tax=Nocardia sp. alder85J TaxID=2862949 RepID=UPI001CD66768|nr:sensor histidine kinase [Nocardia sp. alder85J]MCX4097571.1 sensor histidine kinase [Nocardia sp. alder85J]